MLKSNQTLMRTAILVGISLVGLQTVSAAILGYWRFENGEFLTDSTGGDDLVMDGTPTEYTLPGSGAGSDFPSTIPLTGDPNEQGVSFDGTARFRPDVVDNDFNTGRTATFETYFNANNVMDNSGLFGLWGSEGQYRQFKVFLNEGVLGVGVHYNNDNTANVGTELLGTSFSVSAGVDYYTAVVVSGNSTGDVTFYLQDLTNGGSMQTETISLDPLAEHQGNFHDMTNNFKHSLGSDSPNHFNGIMDEARVANHAMASEELLAIPEPSTLMMFGLSGLALMALIRRRRS